MPYVKRPGAAVFFDVAGDGPETVLTMHGLAECGAYWSRTGVSGALADAGYRVIDIDMRGHGRSVPEAGDPGYRVDTVASDIGAVADAVGAEQFHLLTHATGGMAGLRHAMTHHERLLSLMSTDTGSATLPSDIYSGPDYAGEYPPPLDGPVDNPAVAGMEQYTITERLAFARGTDGRPFLSGFAGNEDPDRCWRWVEDILGTGHPVRVAEFGRHFYTDADPRVDLLRQISCPNLVLLGELDEMFVKPSELLAMNLTHVEHVVVAGRGHMLAIEDPGGTAATILGFLQSL